MMMLCSDGGSSYMLTCLKELASALRCCSREVLREAGRQVVWTVEDMEEDVVGLWTVEEMVGLSVGCTVPLHWKGGAEGVHWVKETHMCTCTMYMCTFHQDLSDAWRIYPDIPILIIWYRHELLE